MGVAQGGKSEFRTAPEDEIFTEAREMSAQHGEAKEKLGEVVPIGNGVHRVGGHAVEAELLGDRVTVQVDGGSSEGTRAEGADVESFATVAEARLVAFEHFDVGQEMVAHGDWLSTLQVGVARDDGVGMGVRLGEECLLEARHEFEERVDGGAAIETGVGRDLIVA